MHIADDPLSAVAEGTGRVLSEIEVLRSIAQNNVRSSQHNVN